MSPLVRVCAWCGRGLGLVASPTYGVTHGMCDDCFTTHVPTEHDTQAASVPASPEKPAGVPRQGEATS